VRRRLGRACHEKSIVHRDLKPALVKVMPEGRVKVLDSGLAKACRGKAGRPSLALPHHQRYGGSPFSALGLREHGSVDGAHWEVLINAALRSKGESEIAGWARTAGNCQ